MSEAPTDDQVPANPTTSVETRTFLIADIRGYTTYTREHGDEKAAALAARFAAIVEEVVATRDGFLLELRGDEALVVFVSARQALRAAIDLQERFRIEDLPRGVGIGIDAGEAIPVGDGFRGTALNLAARLCARARPGETLASEAVIHLAAKVEGIAYVEPRTLRLKGFDDPIRAVDVLPADRVPRGMGTRVRGARRRLGGDGRLQAALVAVIGVGAVAVIATGGGLGSTGAAPQTSAAPTPRDTAPATATAATTPSDTAPATATAAPNVNITVTASSSVPGRPPELAIDRDRRGGSFWSAGQPPPGWIAVDLGAEGSLAAVELVVIQNSPGQTVHVVEIRGEEGQWTELTTFSGHTETHDVLSFRPPAPLAGVRHVRVTTLVSTFWPEWYEIVIER